MVWFLMRLRVWYPVRIRDTHKFVNLIRAKASIIKRHAVGFLAEVQFICKLWLFMVYHNKNIIPQSAYIFNYQCVLSHLCQLPS